MENIFLHFYGTGNAWPVLIESNHPFYNRKKYKNLTNASFSVIGSNRKSLKNINWEILIDAGHGVPQYIIKHHNRIPEAIVLTHPHFDHTAGLDWIVQSSLRIKNKPKYPVYASNLTIEYVQNTFPHLIGLIEWKELKFGEKLKINEIDDFEITPLPVWHGIKAPGATLLSIKIFNKKIIYTGDILCPLIKPEEYKILANADFLISDANNRFPYPESNHWSITGENDKFQKEWIQKIDLKLFKKYLNDYSFEPEIKKNLIFNLFDFIKKINPQKAALVHYSGKEDFDFHGKKILGKKKLLSWINRKAKCAELKQRFVLPRIGKLYKI